MMYSYAQVFFYFYVIDRKINTTKSFTEAEIIDVDNAMNFVMLVNLFIEKQIKTFPNKSIIKKLGSKTVIQ